MGGTLNLLLVEDSEVDGELVVLELRRYGFDVAVERVESGPALRDALTGRSWDVVVCDHGLPGFDSREALLIVRATTPDTPFVVLSGSIGEEAAVEALRSGARDVVLKSNLSRLGPVVDRELVEARNRRRQREAEEALHESEARKSAILDSALDAVIAIDHEGAVIDFNPAAERMFGYARPDVVGRCMGELLVPPSLRGRHKAGVRRIGDGGESTIIGRRVELTGMRADGSEFPVELSITRGELFGRPFFTGYIRDITERRRAEEERASLEAQLRQAQKMDAIGSPAGSITHDFNNILAVVNGYSDLVLRGLAADDPLRPQIEEIARAGEKAAALTRQLLRRMVGDRVDLVTRLEPDLDPVRADSSQLEQVVMNLAVNARDAMPDGGTLTIETRSLEDARTACTGCILGAPEGPCVLLSVVDTGVGVEPELRERIFEPFFTHEGGRAGHGPRAVDRLRDRRAERRVRLGRLRARPGSEVQRLPSARGRPGGRARTDAGRARAGPRLRHGARRRGRRGAAAARPRAARARRLRRPHRLRRGRRSRPLRARRRLGRGRDHGRRDAGMGGVDLGRELRALRPGLRLLYMSGYSEEWLDEAGPGGARVAFIQKPFSPATLEGKLRELLDSP